jgi:hypothetical protein
VSCAVLFLLQSFARKIALSSRYAVRTALPAPLASLSTITRTISLPTRRISVCVTLAPRLTSTLSSLAHHISTCDDVAHRYVFDCAFSSSATQSRVYDNSARAIVSDFLNGVSGVIMAYGQTGSGKTHTMHGADMDAATAVAPRASDGCLDPRRGVVPRALAEVLEWAASSKGRRGATSCTLRMSYVEVYGRDVTNLLADGDDPSRRVGAWAGVAAQAVREGRCAVPVRLLIHVCCVHAELLACACV